MEDKKKVGRPKGTTKINKKDGIYEFKLRVDNAESELIELGFKEMGLNKDVRGNKKKFIMNLVKFYLSKN